MDLGTKLKQARQSRNVTQETLAERLGVSRQTISNWENNRSYPDIVSIIALSDLYGVSLDALLKGDPKMIEHLQQQTNTVKSRRQLSKAALLSAYLLVWAGTILAFWLGGRKDAMGYSLAAFYLALPAATLVCAAFIGREKSWAGWGKVMIPVFGLAHMLAPYATFSLANRASLGRFAWPDLQDMAEGVLWASVGVLLGVGLRTAEKRRKKRDQSVKEKE